MLLPLLSLFPLALVASATSGTSHSNRHASHRRSLLPSIKTSDGTTWVGRTALGVDTFRGIPFAKPPVGELRFAPPQPPNGSFGTFDAGLDGLSCPEMFQPEILSEKVLAKVTAFNEKQTSENPVLNHTAAASASEDCLTLNVFRPAGLNSTAGLPVMYWIFPGGFFFGGAAVYDMTAMVQRSVAIGQPTIFVAGNHRTNSFGFLPGKEVAADPTASVNAGLMDQRLGLEWVSQYITPFGGDPSKVTIFGQSSGAISVGFQLEAYNGNITSINTGLPLFRGAIMQSGSPIPVDVTSRGQNSFDVIAKATGCYNVSEPIACLRKVPYDDLFRATKSFPRLSESVKQRLRMRFETGGLLSPTLCNPTFQENTSIGRRVSFPAMLGVNVAPAHLHFFSKDGANKTLLQFTDGATSIIPDTYREAAISYLVNNIGTLAL
ncbi:hypothetical protein P7C70_g3252, partial [Phenoliferia sp. Uapishka_3]